MAFPARSLRTLACLAFSLAAAVTAKEYSNVADLPLSTYDFVIVGGGNAGLVVANRLTENPAWSVLVIEAGPSNLGILNEEVPALAGPLFAATSPYTWKYTVIPQENADNRQPGIPRGKMLGGSTAINEMWYTRGSAEDFDRFAAVTGDKGWGWDEMLPYFFKNERWTEPADKHNTTGQYDPAAHGTDGITAVSLPGYPWPIFDLVMETAASMPDEFPFVLDYNAGKPIGLGWTQTTINGGFRHSSAQSYLADQYISRPNLHVLVTAQVSRVLPASKGSTHFTKVEFSQDFETLHTVTATKEIILSAGSLATPQILLQSGIGNSTTLKRIGITPLVNLPAVGQNMTEQPLVSNSWFANTTQSYESYNLNATQMQIDLALWNETHTGPLVSSSGAQVAFLRLPEDSPILSTFSDPAAGPETPHIELEFTAGIGLVTPVPAGGGHFISVQAAVVSCASRGTVTLNETDPSPWNLPVIDTGLFREEFDFQTMVYAVKQIFKFLASPVWDGYLMQPLDALAPALESDAGLEAYIRSNVINNQHPVGTAGMSPKGASWGVTDPDLLLKKATGIRVIDSSVLPYVVSGHTMAATYAFAERGSDLVKATWAHH
ncbi:aryl-alcohol-oxidase from pleurotus Eryingii [Roridomyces roridus]|uniref:Aryl-alcohol-oxidase from pleurotus Eryingii n=1 Tax=Roridomyces roridus TaxID=1738132 RepID=A0AAD7FIJ5_9AGAR|nr:aryl-alcohol-oxidase from pleurotus Eryingii [Roridomyces roridus]